MLHQNDKFLKKTLELELAELQAALQEKESAYNIAFAREIELEKILKPASPEKTTPLANKTAKEKMSVKFLIHPKPDPHVLVRYQLVGVCKKKALEESQALKLKIAKIAAKIDAGR